MGRCIQFFPVVLALAAACGGSGGGGAPVAVFQVSGTVPGDGSVAVAPDGSMAVAFSGAVDLASVTTQTIEVLRRDNSRVAVEILKQQFNPSNVLVRPLVPLEANEIFRLVVKAQVRSSSGAPLGADRVSCFLTSNPVPTVRPDQVVDLGDRLNVPRYLARALRLRDGRFAVFGGFSDPTTATDAIEIWNPESRTFELQQERLTTPRAEFTATMLEDGRILIAGGVATPGGPPLASTEFYLPTGTVVPGPPMNVPRRWHGASGSFGGSIALVSGGFDGNGDFLDSIEALQGGQWVVTGALPEPSAQHVHVALDGDTVYFSAGNFQARAAVFSGVTSGAVQEGDIRFRTEAALVDGDRVFVVAGDTRSIGIFDFSTGASRLASDLLQDRRGAYALTARGDNRFVAAGGHRLSDNNAPLDTIEVVEYLPAGPFGAPDAVVHPVQNVRLPVPMAGLVSFKDNTGAAVLAGGIGGGAGPHLRRVVLILDDSTTPPPSCR